MYKKNKIISVTVGIPAYNEAQNIGWLLYDLNNQVSRSYRIKQIIVYSDGSTDDTVRVVKQARNSLVMVIKARDRRGQSKAQNAIIQRTKTDVLVLLNADIRLLDKRFLERLISPIVRGNISLTSCVVSSFPVKTLFIKILSLSNELKQKIYSQYNNGDNVYTCHGRARALSKQFYSKLKFPTGVLAEDAYSYLACKSMGLKYKYITSTRVWYQLPSTLEDHAKQSVRFIQSKSQLEDFVGEKIVKRAYMLPITLVLTHFFAYIISRPIHTVIYLIILSIMVIRAQISAKVSSTWEVSASSKRGAAL